MEMVRKIENEGMLMTITLDARTVTMVTLEARAVTKASDASNWKRLEIVTNTPTVDSDKAQMMGL